MSDYQQLVAKTFLDPIKNVLVIDDEFPSYNIITRTKAGKPWDIDRARDIFKFFQQKRGLICSFENNFSGDGVEQISRTLGNSDLLILDYHLNGDNDSTLALSIIKKIADTTNFNLIVVYTADANDNPKKTIFEILVNLCSIDKSGIPNEVKDFVATEEEKYKVLLDSVTIDHAIDFVCGKNGEIKKLKTSISGIIPNAYKKMIDHIVKYAIYDKFPQIKQSAGTNGNIIVGISDFPYIKGNNFFITVAGKKTIQPNKLFKHLERSLIAWKPEPVLLTLHGLLNELKNNAPKHINAVLKDENMVNGWLFHAKKDTASSANLKRLADSLMAELSASVTAQYFDTDKKYLYKKAIKSNLAIIHALNRYLCTYTTILTNHLTTGIILFNENKNEYWLVLNCACDLVPGQKFPWKENTTKPWQPFTAVKLISSKCCNKHLKIAERGECIFIEHKNDRMALQFWSNSNPNPHYEVLYAESEGIFTDKKIKAHRFIVKQIKDESTNTEKPDPVLEPVEFNVIAQLRYEYACRFLQMLVSNKGRIGVDFVSLPK